MTCIATDGKTIAADSRSCVGDLIVNEAVDKLYALKDGSIIGCAGSASVARLVRKWFDDGADHNCIPVVRQMTPPEDADFEVLICHPDGSVEYMDCQFFPIPREVPSAIGTGGQIAVGAMRAGRSPAEAVAIAAECVTSVGGKIVELKPKKAG